jgi:hypothetical protein
MNNYFYWELMVSYLVGEDNSDFAAKTVEFMLSDRVVGSTVVAERS